jgi:hypothetical protein
VQWATPASEAALPAPSAEADAAAAAAAPHLQALQQRLAAAGPWAGAALLPAGASWQALPESIHYGRIFVTKREHFSACMERGCFVSNRWVAGRQGGLVAGYASS